MAANYIDCPRCGWELRIDDEQAGQRVTCPKCKESFVADVGGSYDLADAPRPPATDVRDDPWSPPATPRQLRPSPPRKEPEPKELDPGLEDMLERWAEE